MGIASFHVTITRRIQNDLHLSFSKARIHSVTSKHVFERLQMLGLVLPDLYEAIANVGRISSLGESTVVELVESRVVERIDRVLDPKGRLKQLDVYACKYRERDTIQYPCNFIIEEGTCCHSPVFMLLANAGAARTETEAATKKRRTLLNIVIGCGM